MAVQDWGHGRATVVDSGSHMASRWLPGEKLVHHIAKPKPSGLFGSVGVLRSVGGSAYSASPTESTGENGHTFTITTDGTKQAFCGL